MTGRLDRLDVEGEDFRDAGGAVAGDEGDFADCAGGVDDI